MESRGGGCASGRGANGVSFRPDVTREDGSAAGEAPVGDRREGDACAVPARTLA